MKLLFISHYSGVYGAAKSMLSLILDLRDRYGVDSIVLLPTDGPLCDELRSNNIKYYISHYYWWVNDNKGVFQWLLNKRKQLLNFYRLKRILRILEGDNIDIVYSNSVTINIGMFIANKLNVSHVWHFRESLVQFNLSLSLSLSLSKYLLRQSTNKAYIMISDYMMDFYKSYLPEDRMKRIYNGISLPETVCRKNPNVLLESLKIACVGVLSDQKNQLELLRAVNLLKDKNKYIEVYLIGTSKTEYQAILTDYVLKNSLENNIHFIGHVDNVWSILKSMNIGVVCARDEAFGRTTIEFMLMKMPIIVSNSGANPELINNDFGKIYELGNCQQLANTIEYYYDNPNILHEEGEIAYKHVIKNFSREQNTDNIYNLLTTLKQ